jgi:hypothetical protein
MAIARTPSEVSIAHTGPESSIARGLARFRDPQLEVEFQVENFELSTRRFLRFSIALTSVVFLAYGVHDLLVVPSVHIQAWKLRYGIFLPVALGVMALAQSRLMLRWHQLAVLVFGMAANLVVVWIGAISPPQGFYLYTSYVTLFVTLGPFIARMNVTTQAVYTMLSIALYNVFDAIFTHSPAEVRWSMSCTILAARQLELQARESFLQRRVIQRQVAELEVEKKKSDALLLNVLPPEIAQRLKTQSESIAYGFAEVTVLFADIDGFTRLSEKLSPEALATTS